MRYILLLATLICYTSCKESKHNCRLKRRITPDNTFEYNYQNDKLISVTAKGFEMRYSYDEKGRLKSYATGNIKSNYIYDEQGKPTTVEGYFTFQDAKFRYDDHGQMVELYYTELNPIKTDTLQQRVYEYKNGLPFKSRTKTHGKWDDYEIYYKFDDKQNPFIGHGPLQSPEISLGYPIGNCKHNLIQKIEKDIVTGKILRDIKWDLEYNEGGYPMGLTKEDRFEYDCD